MEENLYFLDLLRRYIRYSCRPIKYQTTMRDTAINIAIFFEENNKTDESKKALEYAGIIENYMNERA